MFAVELSEAGVLGKEIDGLELSYGDFGLYAELLTRIAFREGFGDLMAEGSRRMAHKIGGSAHRYTREIKGLELMPGTLPHYFNALAHAFSGRGGCHTRSQCFVVTRYLSSKEAEKRFGTKKAIESRETEGKARMLAYYEDLLSVGDSVGVCNFFMGESCSALGFEQLSKLLYAAIGMELTASELRECGERIINLERLFNQKRGIKREDDMIPPRLVSEDKSEHEVVERDLNRMLDEYYGLRGWTHEGVPEVDTLKRLNLTRAGPFNNYVFSADEMLYS